MRARSGRVAAAIVAACAAVVAVAIPTASADSRSGIRALEQRGDELAARSHSTLLELYALNARVERAEAELATVRGREATVSRERAAATRRLRIATRSVELAERSLAERVRTLYEQGEPDPLAILLGAGSLGEALTDLDGLEALAQHDREIAALARAARLEHARLAGALSAHASLLARVNAQAAAATKGLAASYAAKLAHLAQLRAKRSLTVSQLAELERATQAASRRSARLTTPGDAAVETAVASRTPATGLRTMRVLATGYAIRGMTATGIPTGWGVVAVDPFVIPLGTRITIPGYGMGIAADVGSGVRGAMIDVWFPTVAKARSWGRRTVTIMLH